MAETTVNTYSTTATNGPAATPNPVAVVLDTTGAARQIVTLGAGDGSATLLSPALDGTDGAAPPTVPGSGIRGWLRSIYDRLSGLPNEVGTYNYASGAAGTVTPPSGARVTGVSAWGGGTIKVGTGPTITVPNPGSVNMTPRGQLVANAGLLASSGGIVFASTTGYLVEYLT